MKYQDYRNIHPKLENCFFAFSNEQFEKGKKEHNLQDAKILSANGGLYGTFEGISKLFADYENINKEIAENCDPQDVYKYEFGNHECSYTCDDEEAIKIVIDVFGEERAKQVIRRYGYFNF